MTRVKLEGGKMELARCFYLVPAPRGLLCHQAHGEPKWGQARDGHFVECLPSMPEALDSMSCTTEKHSLGHRICCFRVVKLSVCLSLGIS